MTDRWIDTKSDDDAHTQSGEFWAEMREDVDAGEFWSERIKKYRGAPAKRLKLAIQHLPLPAAFKESAIAARALIRAKRKSKEPYKDELALLYWLAAMRSFILDYAPRLRAPGFNVISAIPGQRMRNLDFTYSELGYQNLELLNKTDIKWIVAERGEPNAHTTLNAIHKKTWDEYESKLIEEKERADDEFIERMRDLLSPNSSLQEDLPKSEKGGCLSVIAIFICTAMGGAWLL